MKQRILIVITLALAAGLFGCKKNESLLVYDRKYIKEIKEIRKEIGFYMTRNFVPGGTFAIYKDGNLIYSEGLGMASRDLEVRATRNTKFRIGDVTEVFTSLMFRMMVEDGTLHPDSTVQHYFPEFPQKDFKITLAQLAEHTSGIREPNGEEADWRGLNVSLESGIDQFINDELNSAPDWYQFRSMFNYNLLGVVMEKATGKHYEELLHEYITDTLQLTNTVVDHPLKTIIGRTDFFDHNMIAQVVNATFRDMRYRAPSQGLLSNADDLAKFGNAVLNSPVISENVKKRLFEPRELLGDFPATMANSWYLLISRKGEKLYGKTGGVTGGGAALLLYPDKNLVIAASVNLTSTVDDIPILKMVEFFLDPVEENQTSGEPGN